MTNEPTMAQENAATNATLIKQKVDEANDECWKIIRKKAFEAGILNNSRSMWLFYNRVNLVHYSIINGVRMKVAEEINETK